MSSCGLPSYGIVDSYAMYLVYGLGLWLDWKGAQSME
jgi:hypothetical protein